MIPNVLFCAARATKATFASLAFASLAFVLGLTGCGADGTPTGVGADVSGLADAGDDGAVATDTNAGADAGTSMDADLATDSHADVGQLDGAAVDATDSKVSDGSAGDGASSDGASSDGASSDGGAADASATDAFVGCSPACTMTELCTSGVCTKIVKPCGGACASGSYCDVSGGGAGVCMSSSCSLPSAFPDVQKVSYMEIAPSDKGCDLDGDGKVDNVFGKLLKVYPAANTELLKSIQEGLFILLFQADGWKTDGTKFALNGYLGELDSSNASCSPTASFTNCKYTVDADNFGTGGAGICPAQVHLTPAVVTSGELDAGGVVGSTMTIQLPVVGGLDVTLSNARLLGSVNGAGQWKTTKKGRICGVMTLADFNKAIDAVPADAWKQIGLDKALVAQVLATFLAPDIDLNMDGTPDAISMALLFEGVPGEIVKVIP